MVKCLQDALSLAGNHTRPPQPGPRTMTQRNKGDTGPTYYIILPCFQTSNPKVKRRSADSVAMLLSKTSNSQKCNFWHHHTTKSEEKADSSWWMAVNHEIAWIPSPPLQPCSLACAQEGSQNLCSSRTGALGASVHLTQRNWDWMHAEEGVDRRRAKWLRPSCSKASPNVSSSHRSLWVQLHAGSSRTGNSTGLPQATQLWTQTGHELHPHDLPWSAKRP